MTRRPAPLLLRVVGVVVLGSVVEPLTLLTPPVAVGPLPVVVGVPAAGPPTVAPLVTAMVRPTSSKLLAVQLVISVCNMSALACMSLRARQDLHELMSVAR